MHINYTKSPREPIACQVPPAVVAVLLASTPPPFVYLAPQLGVETSGKGGWCKRKAAWEIVSSDNSLDKDITYTTRTDATIIGELLLADKYYKI